jgi:RNA polymerase sigma factor (sigma-70 family)
VSRERDDFTDFYQSSWGPCLRALVASGASPAAAEEQLAEAFARAWAAWRKVGAHPAPRAWVVRTALNFGASWWRRRRREVVLAGQEHPPEMPPGAGWDRSLLEAVRALPLRERQVVVLRLLLDLDTATTARQLGVAPGTVRAHMARALAALRLQVVTERVREAEECATTI